LRNCNHLFAPKIYNYFIILGYLIFNLKIGFHSIILIFFALYTIGQQYYCLDYILL
jgi:hypothetical protein